MTIHANKLACLVILLCLAASANAQEKIETPSQKSKEAVNKLRDTPGTVNKTLQALGKTVGARLGLGAGEVKTANATAPAVPNSVAQNQNEEAQPPAVPVLGKRDPFRPFTLNNRSQRRPRQNLTPLERYELGQLKLVGVIVDVKQPNALVEDPLGFGYKISIGTPIGANEGKVKAIQQAGLVVEEYQFDVYGARKKIERSMKLAPEKAE